MLIDLNIYFIQKKWIERGIECDNACTQLVFMSNVLHFIVRII